MNDKLYIKTIDRENCTTCWASADLCINIVLISLAMPLRRCRWRARFTFAGTTADQTLQLPILYESSVHNLFPSSMTADEDHEKEPGGRGLTSESKSHYKKLTHARVYCTLYFLSKA